MADETQALRNINWREVFPFTNIFRTFRVAIHPSKLLLALALLLLVYAGGRALDAVWMKKHTVGPNDPFGQIIAASSVTRGGANEFGMSPTGAMPFEDPERWAAGFQNALRQAGMDGGSGAVNPLAAPSISVGSVDPYAPIFKTFFNYETTQVNAAATAVVNGNWLGMGQASVVQALTNFVFNGPKWFFSAHPLFATLFAIWFLVLLSVFGGAIARIAALHIARDEKISVRQALRFSTGKVLSFAFAPVIPLLILLALAVVLGLAGAGLLYIKWAGPIVLGAGFVFVLLASFVMTLVLFGTVGGFNLMYPTVAVEGSDSFDAISRSFSYVFARPWRTIFYTAVALAYGALTYLFVRLFLVVMLMLAHGSVGWFLGKTHQPHAYWEGQTVTRTLKDGKVATYNDLDVSIWPAPRSISLIGAGTESLTYDVPYKGLKWSEDIGASLIWAWVHLAVAMLGAYVISFYFSANSMIYFLLRREVDATDLDDVYVEQADEDFSEPVTETVTPPAPAVTQTPVVDVAAQTTPVNPTPTASTATESPGESPVTKLPSSETPPPT